MRAWISLMVVIFLGPIEIFGQATPHPKSKPNLIVLTDMTSIQTGVREPDDGQSMIRLMLYADEFNIKGLIASSGLGGMHGQVVRPGNIRKIVDAYAKDRPKLLLHDSQYPAAKKLRREIKSGQPVAGRKIRVFKSIGKGKDTQASRWIIQKVDKATNKHPIWITIWGGSADLAQALWNVRHTRSPRQVAQFITKIRVIASGDQDSTGPWIRSHFPDLFYVTHNVGARGMYREGDTTLVSSGWVQRHIKGHGALGNLYPDYKGGDIWVSKLGKVTGIKSGDATTFLGLIPNGLNMRNHLTWENWGGRLKQSATNSNHYSNAVDSVGSYKTDISPYLAAVYRWRPAFQADFQARLNWCVQPYGQSNHAPKNSGENSIVKKQVESGKKVQLRAGDWSDPDGNRLTFRWQMLKAESSYPGKLTIAHASSTSAYFTAPSVNQPQTIHVLLTVRDDGQPSLYSYQRFNVTVHP